MSRPVQASVGAGEHPGTVELQFRRPIVFGEIGRPESLYRGLSLRGKRREVARLQVSKADGNARQRELPLGMKDQGERPGACIVGEMRSRVETIQRFVLEEIAHDDEPPLTPLGDRGELLPCNVECAKDVGSRLVRIERCGLGGELFLCLRLETPEIGVVGFAFGGSREAQYPPPGVILGIAD
jgi:hypothetical protein